MRNRLGLIALALASALALAAPALGEAAQQGGSGPDGQSAAQRLAEAYAPIAMVREQRDPPCDKDEEQYEPTHVETVLGNPAVELRLVRPDGKQETLLNGPDVADVAGLGEEHHLDSPGDPLGDTCVYARDFAQLREEGHTEPVVYAHIARQAGRRGIALQYWFFWYFNQFNDVHEGDWEGMQIAFGQAESPAEALASEPDEVILFQHAGGERARWDDPKLQREGDHPIVFPAAGSHATFYDSAVYVEHGQQGSGVGCDNTTEPLREIRPRPVLLPESAPAQGRFAWLTYEGRWGQKEKGFNNGPTGPATKTQWTEPFSWMEEQRSTSPRLPGGSVVGPAVTEVFCGAVTAVTDLINLEAQSPLAAAAVVLTLLTLLVLLIVLPKWRPIDLVELRARRSFGQIVRGARVFYGRHWRVLVPIGLAAIPIVGGATALGELIAGGGREVDDVVGRSGAHLALADLVTSFGAPLAMAVIAAVAIVFVREVAAARRAGVLDSFRGMWRRFRRVVAAQLLGIVAVTAMAITVVGIPFAIWKYVSWLFVQQEVLFTDKSIRDAFRGSSDLVRGRWWRTLRVAAFLWLISVVVGPVLGFALIFLNLSLFWINVLGSVVFSLFVPYVAVGGTLLYFDLQERAETEPVRPRRSPRPWRRRRARGATVPASG